jgi:hypothetical protein
LLTTPDRASGVGTLGLLVAGFGVIITSAILYPVLNTISPQVQQFFFDGHEAGINLYQYALSNAMTVIGLQIVLSLGLAVVSSLIAIRRYLR